jgi:F-type H+-transporting ATPase subunit gamma
MPSLIDLRRRIRAVKSTQQITKAMKMIAASRLKRAQDRVVAARPFAQRMLRVLNGLVSRGRSGCTSAASHSAAGLGPTAADCHYGGTGASAAASIPTSSKRAGQFILNEAPGRAVALGLVGRKGRDFFRRRGFDVRYETVGIFQKMTFADAMDIADAAIEDFTSGAASSVYLVYNEFKSVMTQRLVVERLLPIPRLEGESAQQEGKAAGPTADYLYEPSPEEIFRDLLPRHVQIQVYRALLESNAAFFAAQMTAMDAATRNSTEMIENLTLYMNKVRQAAITREIIEVVSGAAAT